MRISMAIEMGRKRRLEGEITLQKQESGSSGPECAAHTVNVADYIRRRHGMSLIALSADGGLFSIFSNRAGEQQQQPPSSGNPRHRTEPYIRRTL